MISNLLCYTQADGSGEGRNENWILDFSSWRLWVIWESFSGVMETKAWLCTFLRDWKVKWKGFARLWDRERQCSYKDLEKIFKGGR